MGFALYLATVGSALCNTLRVLAAVRGRPELKWAGQLARMLQLSLAGFLSGGAALSMAYYDGFLIVFALTAALLETAIRSRRSRRRLRQSPSGSASTRPQ